MTEQLPKYAAIGTICVLPKLFRGLTFASQIEEIVVDEKFRGKGLGKNLILFLLEVSQSLGCYKASLCCKEELIPFYSKTGMTKAGPNMSKYFTN